MCDVIAFHQAIHDSVSDVNVSVADFSVDGVKECNSNKVSLNVHSIRFTGCRNIYPLLIQRPVLMTSDDGKEEAQRGLKMLVDDLK